MGLISKTLAWISHPFNDDSDPIDWFAFFVLTLIVAYLWSKVLRQLVEG
jgi:hypothetical protein